VHSGTESSGIFFGTVFYVLKPFVCDFFLPVISRRLRCSLVAVLVIQANTALLAPDVHPQASSESTQFARFTPRWKARQPAHRIRACWPCDAMRNAPEPMNSRRPHSLPRHAFLRAPGPLSSTGAPGGSQSFERAPTPRPMPYELCKRRTPTKVNLYFLESARRPHDGPYA
jgi:hypothetical protein